VHVCVCVCVRARVLARICTHVCEFLFTVQVIYNFPFHSENAYSCFMCMNRMFLPVIQL
jgi:hypothetical protein